MLLWTLLALWAMVWLANLRNLLQSSRDDTWRLTPDRFPDPEPSRTVSVVIPARNEERNIEACLAGVLAQEGVDLQVVVVDDGSTDRTPEILARLAERDHRVTVVQGQGPPPGWTGKVAACWAGQAHATGEVLLFLDADVRLHPSTLAQCLAYMEATPSDGVTLIGRLVTESFWERVIQPVVGSLILVGNPPSKVNDPDAPDAVMANGQFIMLTREVYDLVGGHEAIKGEILDDVALARLVKAKGRKLHLLLGMRLMEVRMYDGLAEIWEGWTKNLFLGMHRSVPVTLGVLGVVFLTALAPFIAAGWLVWSNWPGWWHAPQALAALGDCGLVYLVYGMGLARTGHRVVDLWTYPLGVVMVLAMLGASALRGILGLGVSWKGRTYSDIGTGHPEREEGQGD